MTFTFRVFLQYGGDEVSAEKCQLTDLAEKELIFCKTVNRHPSCCLCRSRNNMAASLLVS